MQHAGGVAQNNNPSQIRARKHKLLTQHCVDSLFLRPIAHQAPDVEPLELVRSCQRARNCHHHSLYVVRVERPDGFAPHGKLVLRVGLTDEERLMFRAGMEGGGTHRVNEVVEGLRSMVTLPCEVHDGVHGDTYLSTRIQC